MRSSVVSSATAAAADLDRWVKESNDARLQALEVCRCYTLSLSPDVHCRTRGTAARHLVISRVPRASIPTCALCSEPWLFGDV